MSLTQMTPGGRWFRPPHNAPPVYVPPKQLEAHFKLLVGDGFMPIDDPRREEDQVQPQATAQEIPPEVAMQARIDQLEAMIKQLLAKQVEAPNGSTINDVNANSENASDDKRSRRGKPAV